MRTLPNALVVAVCAALMGHAIAEETVAQSQSQSGTAIEVTVRLQIDRHVAEASKRFRFDARLIKAVIEAESNGDRRAVSPKGAMGLMQLMPETWRELRARYGLGADPFDPRDNIIAGSAYLRELHDRFGSRGFLAAYNAGPERYRQHIEEGRQLPRETRNYVAKIARILREESRLKSETSSSDLQHAGAAADLFPAKVHSTIPALTVENRDGAAAHQRLSADTAVEQRRSDLGGSAVGNDANDDGSFVGVAPFEGNGTGLFFAK